MNKLLKNIFAVLLSIVMVFSFSGVAMAERVPSDIGESLVFAAMIDDALEIL